MLERELERACALARRAGHAIETLRLAGFDSRLKADRSPVTEADLASDRILREGLNSAFPKDGWLSEESADHLGTSGRTWVVDPLDGTRGFISDVEGYAVQVGLVVDDTPVLGVVYEARHDRLYFARRGMGAYLEEGGQRRQLRVSASPPRAEMTLVTSSSLDKKLRLRLVRELGLGGSEAFRSVGTKVGVLVRGLHDLYLCHHPISYWDSCGPMVVLQEAGGMWTHLNSEPLTYILSRSIPTHPGPFLVSRGGDHMAMCSAARRILEEA